MGKSTINELHDAYDHLGEAYSILEDYFIDAPGTNYDKQIASDMIKKLRAVKNHVQSIITDFDKYGKF